MLFKKSVPIGIDANLSPPIHEADLKKNQGFFGFHKVAKHLTEFQTD
jgi:hypothetical protein